MDKRKVVIIIVIVAVAAVVLYNVISFYLFYNEVTGMFEEMPEGELSDSYCEDGTAVMVIENTGSLAITIDDVILQRNFETMEGVSMEPETANPGETFEIRDPGCGGTTFCRYRGRVGGSLLTADVIC